MESRISIPTLLREIRSLLWESGKVSVAANLFFILILVLISIPPPISIPFTNLIATDPKGTAGDMEVFITYPITVLANATARSFNKLEPPCDADEDEYLCVKFLVQAYEPHFVKSSIHARFLSSMRASASCFAMGFS